MGNFKKLGGRVPSGFCVVNIILIITVLLVLSHLSESRPGINADCVINLGPYANRHLPLIASRKRGLLLPSGSRSIIVHKREFVKVICPGKNNNVVGHRMTSLNATCKNYGNLLEGPNSLPFTLNCSKPITETIVETSKSCGSHNNSKIINIGWNLENQGFHHQIEICFNEDLLITEFTRHVLKGSGVPYRDRDTSWLSRPGFKQDKFFSGKTPSILLVYMKDEQRKTLTTLLGSRERAEAYIGGWGPSSYLSKGHLSPDADFTLQSWQDATYHFVNVVPQWQAFNNGNWKVLEGAIRIRATNPSPRDLVIYTGTYGIVQLLDVNHNEVHFFLSLGQKLRVPVPKYIWKVVSDPQSNEAVAFILVNHPANPQFPNQLTSICPDVCHKIHWVKWKARNNVQKGIIYCCSVQSARNKIHSIPSLPNVNLMET